MGDRVFVTFQPNNASAAYRSEILRGRVELQEDTLHENRWDRFKKVFLIIAWTRKFYWEANAETQLPL